MFLVFSSYALQPVQVMQIKSIKKLKQVVKHTKPLKNSYGQRFCSSVSIKYKKEYFNVTNRHCCNVPAGFEKGIVRVGDSLERIIVSSKYHDVCVLTSRDKKTPIRLAKKEFKMFDRVTLLGYPRGDVLTPRDGYLISLNIPVEVNYGFHTITKRSNYISTLTFGGNSGSPVFNSKGELVNLLYAGPTPIFMYGVTVPHKYVKAVIEHAYKIKRK